ncbi:MAG: hypothetical protein LUO93_08705 [Methanomicrobiales archaeon]|nr:hypothetical protein [Methanomicrobiales archaeon]
MKRFLLLSVSLLVLTQSIVGCVTPPPGGNITTPPKTTSFPSPFPTVTEDFTSCWVDSDCVPEQCCHPTSCINQRFKGVCTVLCTLVCEGPIDCNAGHCGCEAGTCRVISGAAS